MNRCRLAIAFLLVATLVLGGCSDDPRPKIARPSESSSPTVSESPSAGGPASPRDEQAAFIESYFSEVSASISTGDSAPFIALSSGNCQNCRVLADNLSQAYADGGRIEGGHWRVLGSRHVREAKLGSIWNVRVRSARERWLDGQGDPVKIVRAGTQRFGMAIVSVKGRWLVRELRLG